MKIQPLVSMIALSLTAALLNGCESDAHAQVHLEPGVAEAPEPVYELPLLTLRVETVTQPVTATGTTSLFREADVMANVTAMVSEVLVEDGQWVAEGDPLVRLDSTDLRLRTSQARAQAAQLAVQLGTVEAEIERYRPLIAQGVMTELTLTQLQGQADALRESIQVAQAQVSLARSAQGDAVITAPFAGLIVDVPIAVGEQAAATPPTTLVKLVDMERLNVEFDVPEREFLQLRPGAPVRVNLPATGETIDATVTWLNPSVSANTRMGRAVAVISNADHRLYAGLFARIEVTSGAPREALVVPSDAVSQGGSSPSVFVVTDGVVARRDVTVQALAGGRVELLSGVNAGETVVARIIPDLVDGARVAAPAAGGQP